MPAGELNWRICMNFTDNTAIIRLMDVRTPAGVVAVPNSRRRFGESIATRFYTMALRFAVLPDVCLA